MPQPVVGQFVPHPAALGDRYHQAATAQSGGWTDSARTPSRTTGYAGASRNTRGGSGTGSGRTVLRRTWPPSPAMRESPQPKTIHRLMYTATNGHRHPRCRCAALASPARSCARSGVLVARPACPGHRTRRIGIGEVRLDHHDLVAGLEDLTPTDQSVETPLRMTVSTISPARSAGRAPRPYVLRSDLPLGDLQPATGSSRSSMSSPAFGAMIDRPSSRPADSAVGMTTSAPPCRSTPMFCFPGRRGDRRRRGEPAGGQCHQHAGVVPVGRDDHPVRAGHCGLPEHFFPPGVADHADAAVAVAALMFAPFVSTTTMFSDG